ncbi:hypothetical protein L5515_005825 [Caenorhabditis briggsae]|uniref:Serpentine receptor class r-10 n=1 Tax=Caenorhabditis briggsae TaxID=6238 RepID=A0AAE9JHX9_CAEBR|nr:hypothetical protein L5515_005825 [Caenorhabditis briggsae]
MAVTPLLRICQFSAFSIAVSANLLLLYLIKMRAGTSFGSYQVMMISFLMYAIVYAFIEILTMPVLHIHKSGVLFYVDSVLKFNPIIGELMSSLYCGSFALCISMLATHFIFRYVAVCKPHKLYHFDGNKIYKLFIPPTILFVIWTLSIYFNFGPNQVKKDFFRRVAWELYEEDIDKIAFMGPLYFTRMENGKRLFRFPDLFGAFISCTIMTICLTTCVVCAFKTYRKLNDLTIQMSERTRSLNKQLFWTLGLQTLLPCVTQYIPVGTMFFVPLFEFDLGRIGNLVGAACSLYPAMDPIIAIFMIDRFRNFVLRKEFHTVSKTSKVSAVNEERRSTIPDHII